MSNKGYIIYFLLACIALACTRKSKPLGQIRGTVLIAGFAKDGIILAADSRVSIYETADKSNGPMASIDSFQKIYKINGYPFATSGIGNFGNKFFYSVVEDFNKVKSKPISPTVSLHKFIDFIKLNYPTYSDKILSTNEFIVIGYDNKIPIIATIAPYIDTTMNSDVLLTTDDNITKDFNYDTSMTCSEMAIMIKKGIDSYTEDPKIEKVVGGPITILGFLKKSNKPKYIQNDFTNRQFKDVSDLINSIESNKITVNYYVPNGKSRLIYTLKMDINQK